MTKRVKVKKVRVTKKQVALLNEHLQQYVDAAKSIEEYDCATVKRCLVCKAFGNIRCSPQAAECKDCPLSCERQGEECSSGGYISGGWRINWLREATPKEILDRAKLLKKRINNWIYPFKVTIEIEGENDGLQQNAQRNH